MERKTYTNTAGEDFSYLVHESNGSKFNFVFFHATGFNAETYQIFFDKLINCFGNQVSIYALDQRGHGLSNAKSDHTQLKSWDIFIDDGKEFIDSIEGSVICSGHSMGSIVAAKISSLNPKKVSHLFMIEPVLYGPLESLKFRFMSMIKYNRGLSIADGAAKRRKEFHSLEDAVTSYTGRGAFTTWTKDWISNYLKGGTRSIESGIELSCSPEWEAATFRSSSMDTWRYLKQIKMKVKVVYGSIGSTFSLQARNSLFKLGSHWDSNYYKDASHFLPMEYPDSVIKDLELYLNN